jgi:class 3 adenylate cyclase/ABC-type branched-subunit amino acid transport system substrate-binding protein
MITATLGLLRASGATLTRKTFLDVLYASRTFSFNGVTLGEYSNLCESNSGSCCNTGGRSVIIVRVKSTATRNSIVYSDLVEKVPGADLKYTSCIADPSIVPLPIMFAQVAANISVVGSSTYNYALGVKAAFFAQNYIGGISGRYLALKTYDGHGKSWIMSKDLWAALNRDRVVACLGVYSPTNETLLQEYSYNSTITFLGPLSGSMALRTPFNRNIINIRPSIRDEMAAIANFLHKVLQLSNVVLLVQTTSLIQVWEDGVRGYIDFASNVHGMSPAIIRYTTAQDTSVINQIIQAKDAQAFVLLGSTSSIHGYATLAANISQKLVIAAPNDVDYTQLVSLTGKVLAGRLYVSQLVNLGTSARSLDASAPITGSVLAKRFMDAMNNSEFLTSVQIADGTPFMTNAALEGFIVGRLAVTATQHALAMSTATSTTSANEREAEARALFLEAMYDIASFTVDGFKLGPLGDACVSTSAQQDQCGPSRTNCDCSQMAGSVFISQASVDDPTIMVSRPDGTYSFSTCGVMLPPTIFSFVYIIVIVAVLSVVLVVIVLIVLLIIWRAKKSHSVLYAPSSGLAVLAFTDVQNSTVLWQDFPREMRTALKAHNQIMRKLLKRFRGHEVKTQGDSFMVAFTAPLDALDWAMSVQVELTKYEHWPSDLLLHSYDCRTEWDEKRNIIFKGLRVRIGLHYGEVERLTDPTSGRPDYFGTTVNKAARIEGLAKGGQVLLSSELFDELKPVMFNAITNISAVEEFSEFTDENFTPRQEDTQSKGSANSYKRNKYVINSPSGTMSPDGISYRERTNSSSTATEDFKRAILRQRRISATTKNLDSHYVLYRHYGEHMLKGLSEPNVIFEVFVAELKGRTFDTPQAGETPATPNVARKNVSYIDTSQNERFGTHIDSPVEEDDRHVTLTVPKITHANQVMPV